MRWIVYGALATAMMACSGDKGEVTDTGETGDTDTDTDPRCPNALLESYPEDGTTGVYAWTSVDALLSRSDPGATLSVTDDAGAEVPGTFTLSEDDTRLSWLPDGPMAAGDYTSTLEWTDCETRMSDFTVGDFGTEPVADIDGLVENTYVLDIAESRFVAPENIGDALTTQLEVRLLLGVLAADTDGIDFLAGAETLLGGEQSLDAPTTRFAERATFDNPRFEVSADTLGLVVEGDPITATDLTMSGSFTPDGSAIEGFRMATTIDLRELKDALEQEDDDGPCDLFSASFNVQCTPCPSGDGDYCIDLVIADLTLPLADYTMVEVP